MSSYAMVCAACDFSGPRTEGECFLRHTFNSIAYGGDELTHREGSRNRPPDVTERDTVVHILHHICLFVLELVVSRERNLNAVVLFAHESCAVDARYMRNTIRMQLAHRDALRLDVLIAADPTILYTDDLPRRRAVGAVPRRPATDKLWPREILHRHDGKDLVCSLHFTGLLGVIEDEDLAYAGLAVVALGIVSFNGGESDFGLLARSNGPRRVEPETIVVHLAQEPQEVAQVE